MRSKAAPLLAVAAFCLSCSLDAAEAFSGVDHLHSTTIMSQYRISISTRLFQGQSSIAPPLMEIAENSIASMDRNDELLPSASSISSDSTPTKATHVIEVKETVPSTWSQALHRFFIGDIGPPLVLLTISGFIYTRLHLVSIPFSIAEGTVFASMIVFWWIQEYFFHRVLLHSPFNWMGKSIHQTHHDKNYFHVSIDPPELLLGWLFAAHLMMKMVLPWHLCLSATIGYALAGLVYEWSHYIVHTKVKPPSLPTDVSPTNKSNIALSPSVVKSAVISAMSGLFSQMRDNHVRHHLVDDQYWYAFSVPAMDDLFDTNPDVKDVRIQHKEMTEAGVAE